MPPRAWIESERHAQITAEGVTRSATESGARGEILQALSHGKPKRLDSIARRSGSYAAIAALERDGLVIVTRPLQGKTSAFRTVRVATLTAQGHDVLGRGRLQSASNRPAKAGLHQKRSIFCGALRWGLILPNSPNAASVRRCSGGSCEKGLVAITRRTVDRDPFEHSATLPVVPRQDVTLTAEQQAALNSLRGWFEAGVFTTALLHGVTGSGKTEIYLRLAEIVHRSGRGVLLLVPEIALTPAVAALFRATFGERVAIQHSGLSDGERHDQWQRIRRGDVDVVVGTRSAVFAPVRALGLVIVDEEHDGSYKQEEAPRYHGRDVAIVRARQAAALAVLGSATPSMESFHNAQKGRYRLLALERRVLDRPLASVTIVDMREEYAANGPDVILSAPLVKALGERLQRGEQSIVLLNRRGFATVVFCRQCAHTLECPNCSVSLTVHKAIRRARCHYCNYSMGLPTACVKCAGPYLEQLGFGTERVEAEIRTTYPGCADRARGPRHHEAARGDHLAAFALRRRRARRPRRHADDCKRA